MGKKKLQLKEITKVDPFKTPEGYFESFTADLMSRLPERKSTPVKVISLWDHAKPWAYMAAMFIGLSLLIRVFTGSGNDITKTYAEGLNLSSSTDIEDFYHYYEDNLAKILYEDTMANLEEE